MKANTSTRTRSNHNTTLDLFAPPPQGDGATTPTEPVDELPDSDLPELADIELHRTEPFQVPGLKSPVLPVPVFRVKLVREGTHLTRQVTTPADAARLCSELLEGYDREVFLVIALSTANRVIGAHVAHVGTVDASIASPREVFKFALLSNARSVICAHNHPSGNLEPSKADIQVSKQLQAAGESLSVRLLDSLIIGHPNGDAPCYTSLSEKGLL